MDKEIWKNKETEAGFITNNDELLKLKKKIWDYKRENDVKYERKAMVIFLLKNRR